MSSVYGRWDATLQACKPDDKEFLSELPADVEVAKGICRTCPLVQQCLSEHFLDVDTTIGATSYAERVRALKFGTYPGEVAERFDQAAQADDLRRLLDPMLLDPETQLVVMARHGHGRQSW